jgi:hypothetical protein
MTMGLRALWQRWFNRPAPARRPRPVRRTRLGVECLEGREVPAAFTAASVSDLIADIAAANRSAEADTITLAPGKTFTLTAVNNTDQGATGLPVIAAGGGSLTIVGNGDVIERSTAKGTPAFRLLNVAAGASLALQNLTLQGGYLVGGSYDDIYGRVAAKGGALYSAGELTMTGVTLQNNTAFGGDGAGPLADGGFAEGGAVYSSGALRMSGCAILNNLAIGGKGGQAGNGGWAFGGGVNIASSTATLLGTTITGNEARAGSKGSGFVRDGFGGQYRGQDGRGYGGGLAIWHGMPVDLDAYTVDHIRSNRASTSDTNIDGAYTLLP